MTKPLSAGERIQQNSGKTYYAATKLLPERIREHTHALYGFVRTADEFVDGKQIAGHEQRKAVEAYRRKTIEAIRDPSATKDEVLRNFAQTVRECNIPELEIHAFLDAMALDTTKKRYKDLRDVQGYMRGSATAVGNMMTSIIGVKGNPATARSAARALSEAFQMTNFLRDVREDYEKLGRIYLPQSTLEKHGVTEDDFKRKHVTPGFRKAMHELSLWTRDQYHDGVLGIKQLNKDSRYGVLVAAALYLRVQEKIEAADYDVWQTRVTLSKKEKARLVLRTWWRYKVRKQSELRAAGLTRYH
jgi:phytoene synthase